MNRSTTMTLLAALVLGTACSAAPAEDDPGVETGPCIAGECFDGLMCLSDLCVGDDAGTGDGNSADGSPDDGVDDGHADGSPGDGNDDGNPDGGGPDDGDPDDGDPDDGDPDDGDPDDGDPDDGNDDGVRDCADDPGVALGGACDPMAQDCAGCAKCTPWGLNGTWNAAHCVGVNDNPSEIGQPCVAIESPTSGIDNCREGAMCWNVNQTTLIGECVELCSGTPAAPSCDSAGTICAVANDGLLPLCLTECDPLEGGCPAGEGCYIVFDAPVCAPTVGEAGPGDPCGSVNACGAGTGCVLGGGGCDPSGGCCGEYCDPAAPDCDPDLECAELIDGVGVCVSMA